MSSLFKYILILFVLVPFISLAQEDGDCAKISNKKALKLFEKAQAVYKEKNDNAAARELVQKAIEEEPNYADAYLFMGTLTRRKEEFKLMADAYVKAIEICPNYDPEAYYHLGLYYFEGAGTDPLKYDETIKYLGQYVKFEKTPDKKQAYAEKVVKRAKFYSKLFKNPVPFNMAPVNDVSTKLDEYLPCISADNEVAYFTRRGYYIIPKAGIGGTDKETYSEQFTKSEWKDGKFEEGKPLPDPFNRNNEGGASLSIDNQTMYFTICKPNKKGFTNCDIYVCEYKNGDWGDIKNLGDRINGEDTWESQPSIASDGVTLYFASIRKTNIGFNEKENQTCDIYRSVKGTRDIWSEPQNLGPIINTAGNEKSPFMHGDSKTLYFASDGHPSVGGYDIFFTKEVGDSSWEAPKNIGYPINSENDDLSFIVSTDGKTAFFASDKYKGKGGYDIYSFELYKEARPEKVVFLKGSVKDENGEPTSANIHVRNTKTNKVTEVKVDSTTGRYASIVRLDGDLVVSVKKKNAAFVSQFYSQKDTAKLTAGITKLDVEVKPIQVGAAYPIKDINYKTNSADLMPESTFILDEFITYLKENSTMKIDINGHTDNVGSDQDNMSLSNDRAFTVFEYLNTHGIDKSRLGFHGYGKTKPIASNDTEEGRAKNRRTEFLIVAK